MSLNDEQIVAIITEYIAYERQKQAILIDGAWGSGKTFFVKETLIPNISKKLTPFTLSTEVMYVSLYGLDTTEKVMNEIYASLTASMFSAKKEQSSSDASKPSVVNIGKLGFKILSGVTSTALSAIPITLPEITAEDWSCIDHLTIIFDDLERCAIPINETLGFINNLVEHNEVKAIIVGNEKEIREENELAHQENRPSVEGTETEVAVKIEPCGKSIAYHNVKEKLIGLTIQYQCNLDEVFDKVSNLYVTDSLAASFLPEQKELILSIFKEFNNSNIRTLISVLCSFETIYKVISRLKYKYREHQILVSVSMLSHLTKSTIYHKEGHIDILEKWKNYVFSIKYDNFNRALRAQFSEDLIGLEYRFIDHFIITHYLEEKDAISVFTQLMDDLYRSNKLKLDNLALYGLSSWHHKDTDTITNLLTQFRNELKKELYTSKEVSNGLISVLEIEYFQVVSFDYATLKEQICSYYSQTLVSEEILKEQRESLRISLPLCPEIREIYQHLLLQEITKNTVQPLKPIEIVQSVVQSGRSTWYNELHELISHESNDLILNEIMTHFSSYEYFWTLLSHATSESLYQCEKTLYHIYKESRGHLNYGDNLILHKSRVEKLIQNSDSGQTKYCFTRFLWMIKEELEKYTEKETTS